MEPNDVRIQTDYGVLMGDSESNVISITIPNNFVFDPSNPLLAEAFIDVGTNNAYIRARANTSKYPGWSVGTFMYTFMLYDVPSEGIPPYEGFLLCSLTRVSPTTMRLAAFAEQVPGGPPYRTRESVTITFVFSTFLSPFI